MSRPNKNRTLFAEANLAKRVTMERAARSWTLEGLAKRMTDVGCPIQPSAIYKVERANPPRRIVVDELVAYSKVFDVPVGEMLLDPIFVSVRGAFSLLARFDQCQERLSKLERESDETGREMRQLAQQISELVEDTPAARKRIDDIWRQSFGQTMGRTAGPKTSVTKVMDLIAGKKK